MEKKPKEKMYGNRIKEILLERNITNQELADLSGLRHSHLSRIINGHRKCISLPIAIKISQALKVSVEDVFIYQTPIKTSGDE